LSEQLQRNDFFVSPQQSFINAGANVSNCIISVLAKFSAVAGVFTGNISHYNETKPGKSVHPNKWSFHPNIVFYPERIQNFIDKI